MVPKRLPSGARRYAVEQLDAFIGLRPAPGTRRAAVYARVSSTKQKVDGNLGRQHDRLLAEVRRRGLVLAMDVAEVASGVNEDRRGLTRLLKAAARGSFDVLLVEHQDRLARFGYRYLVAALDARGAKVEVVEDDIGAALNLHLKWERTFCYPSKEEVAAWRAAVGPKTLSRGKAAITANPAAGDSDRNTAVAAMAMLGREEAS